MTNQMKDKFSCIKIIKESQSPCKKIDCRYNLGGEKSLACAIIAAEDGPMTLQEIGDFYGISRMRVCQIEKTILKKLKNQNSLLTDFDPSS